MIHRHPTAHFLVCDGCEDMLQICPHHLEHPESLELRAEAMARGHRRCVPKANLVQKYAKRPTTLFELLLARHEKEAHRMDRLMDGFAQRMEREMKRAAA